MNYYYPLAKVICNELGVAFMPFNYVSKKIKHVACHPHEGAIWVLLKHAASESLRSLLRRDDKRFLLTDYDNHEIRGRWLKPSSYE